MNEILAFLSRPGCEHLAMALLHSLWQGLVVMIVLWFVLRCIPANRPRVRHLAAFSALLCMVLGVSVTWAVLDIERPKRPIAHTTPSTEVVIQVPTEEGVGQVGSGPGKEPGPVQASDARGDDRPAWIAYVILCWLAGVVVMTGRMAWIVARLQRLLRMPEIADGQIRQLVDELRQRMRIGRLVRVVDSYEGFGPAAFGFVRPIMVLPISMISGLPPETVRAIVAHELAHVRRNDYVFNLAQMVIESVFYFNPAVWWINRQIRAEREACCDALAVSILGRPLAVAEALSIWADRVYTRETPAAAMAWSDHGNPRPLLDRVRRMVLPGYRPQSPISPLGLLGAMVSGIVVLGGLWYGTSAAVQLVEESLTPEERVEKVAETQEEYRRRETTPSTSSVTLSGKIRTFDNKPLPKGVMMGAMATTRKLNQNGAYMPATRGIQRLSDSSFSLEAYPGRTWICAGTLPGLEGYASAVAGPFECKEGQTIENIDLVFERGTLQTVRVVDDDGKPVTHAPVTAGYHIGGFAIGRFVATTDEQGIATVRIAKEVKEYSLGVTKTGYLVREGRRYSVKPDQTVTVTVSRGEVVEGTVLLPEGEPAAGARIRLYMKYAAGGRRNASFGRLAPTLTTTDALGCYRLAGLADKTKYLLVAESEAFGRQTIRFETPVKEKLVTKFGPLITVTGVVHEDLDSLAKSQGRPSVYYYQSPSFDSEIGSRGAKVAGYVPVETVDGETRFTLSGLLPGKVVITAGKKTMSTTVEPDEQSKHVTIDLASGVTPDSMRTIVLRFETPDGAVPPRGSVQVSTSTNDKERLFQSKMLSIAEGAVRFDAFAPGRISYGPKEMVGYWFPPNGKEVKPGKEPLTVKIPVFAAGAVKGQVLNADGSPATNSVWIRAQGSVKTTEFERTGLFAWDINVDGRGRFLISSLPMEGEYTVYATHGHLVQFAGPFRLDATRPIADLSLTLPRATEVEGTVVDPDGRPLADHEFRLCFHSSPEEKLCDWGVKTDGEGRFHFADLGAERGTYSLVFEAMGDDGELRVPLALDGKAVEVRLQR